MSTPIPMSGAEHQALQDLLAWYASGSLGEAEARRVQEHLHSCADCRADLAWQRRLLETEGPLPSGLDPERALAKLMPQLDAVPVVVTPAARPRIGGLGRLLDRLAGARWQGWAIAAQCAVIAVLAVQLAPRLAAAPAPAPAYQALGRGTAATPDVLVVFKADARLQDVQRILQANGAQIIGGPTVTGAYMLDVEDGRQAQLLSALRADPSVELAESLTAAGQP